MSKYKRLTMEGSCFDNIINCVVCPNKTEKYTCRKDKTNCLNAVINRLAELEDKIENGTLIELPCRLGEKVYRIRRKPYKAVLERFVVNITYCYDYKGQPSWRIFTTTEDTLGETVFLTKAEAEKKLKELQNDNT